VPIGEKSMPKEKKPLDAATLVKRQRVYASERLKLMPTEVSTLKAALRDRAVAPKDEKKKHPSKGAQRQHIYQVMRLEALKKERAELKALLISSKGAKTAEGDSASANDRS